MVLAQPRLFKSHSFWFSLIRTVVLGLSVVHVFVCFLWFMSIEYSMCFLFVCNTFPNLWRGCARWGNYKVEDSIRLFDEAAESGYPKAGPFGHLFQEPKSKCCWTLLFFFGVSQKVGWLFANSKELFSLWYSMCCQFGSAFWEPRKRCRKRQPRREFFWKDQKMGYIHLNCSIYHMFVIVSFMFI